jgi:hypothetical protein
MSLNTTDIRDAVVSHALSLGRFDQVNQHAPKNPPKSGLSLAITGDRIGGIRSSGLASLSARLVLMLQVFASMQMEPADDIDATVFDAVDALFGAYCGDFTLGGLVRQVDLLGTDGTGLDAVLGYVTVDGIEYRHAAITLPLIINDVWTEEA